MSILEIKNISFKYDKYDDAQKNALNCVSFNVEKKEFVAIIGKSGSGKSTLITHLNGLIKADSGEIYFNGDNIYSNGFDMNKLRFRCGVVFQYPEYQLFSETVLDDVAFGAIKKGLSKNEAYKKSIETLRYLGIEHLKDEIPFNLSGGEKRKVAFAGVFVMEPEVLIFDEPDAGLDPISKVQFYEYIKRLNEERGTTVIFITHNLDDVVEYANKVVVMKDGCILDVGKPSDVLLNKSTMEDAGLKLPYSAEVYYEVLNKGYSIDKSRLKFDEIVNSLESLK